MSMDTLQEIPPEVEDQAIVQEVKEPLSHLGRMAIIYQHYPERNPRNLIPESTLLDPDFTAVD